MKEQTMLLDVVSVEVKPDFVLWLVFENGERRIFNMAAYLDQKPWNRLKLNNLFQSAFIENGTVAWTGNIDIDPETLYEYSTPSVSLEGVHHFPVFMGECSKSIESDPNTATANNLMHYYQCVAH
jgi:hypothetical protein